MLQNQQMMNQQMINQSHQQQMINQQMMNQSHQQMMNSQHHQQMIQQIPTLTPLPPTQPKQSLFAAVVGMQHVVTSPPQLSTTSQVSKNFQIISEITIDFLIFVIYLLNSILNFLDL
jgi:hypothetical protein